MESGLVRINKWLLPLSWLYGLGVGLRNTLFDIGVLKSRSFDVPIISVGNLTVGGTGKTPHTEYILALLGKHHRVAVLSRGYKRKTKGYRLASPDSTVEDIGDEPWQMHRKFPQAYVAVDSDRCHGIQRLCTDESTRDVEVVVLDDAYQHRYVKPGVNILLMDYHRLITDDRLLPAGRLREPQENKNRANLVIVTKCPHNIKPMDFRVIQKALHLRPYQKLYFSTLRYSPLRQLFGTEERSLKSLQQREQVLLITGIASPDQIQSDLRHHTPHITPLTFPDHHHFRPQDVEKINCCFAALPQPRLAVTTEKDATRLLHLPGLSDEVRKALYVLPVEIEILRDQQQHFNTNLIDYVHKNSRNSILAQG